MEVLTTGTFSYLESVLYSVWGVAFISVAFIIVFKPNFREQVLSILDNNYSRYLLAGISFIVALIHLYGYQLLAEGNDFLLVAIGYTSALKGIILLLFPSVLKISEQVIMSRYMSGWFLVMTAMGIYLLNQVLQFITL